MNGMDLCCQDQNKESFYYMFYPCHVSIYIKYLNFFKVSHLHRRCTMLKIHNSKASNSKTIRNFNRFPILVSIHSYDLVSLVQNERTPLKKNRTNSIVNIFVVFILKKNKKWNSVFIILQSLKVSERNWWRKAAVGIHISKIKINHASTVKCSWALILEKKFCRTTKLTFFFSLLLDIVYSTAVQNVGPLAGVS